MSETAELIDHDVRALARDNLHVFAQLAFGELKGEPYQDNWHIAAVARQLEHVERGAVKRVPSGQVAPAHSELLARPHAPLQTEA